MRDEELASEAKRLIDTIASRPRFAGSADEAEARRFCAGELEYAGLTTAEKTFEFSQWPGRWGIPLIAAWVLLSFLAMVLVARVASPKAALTAFMLPVVLGQVVWSRRRPTATVRTKWLRSRSVNLEATRGVPKIWLVAHLDTKSQSVPMLLRVASHIALLSAVVIGVAMNFVQQFGVFHQAPWNWLGAIATVAALPSLFCVVGTRSHGALDNATGVAAVVLAARLIPSDRPFGVLLTSGEELDLAGARAWTQEAQGGLLMINCDTVDDDGGWRCMYGNRPHVLGVAAGKAAKKMGLALRMGKVIPGIITDSLAFETAGLASVTLSRGTLRTLARLHTSGDNPDRVSGSGVATAARLLAQMVEELI